MSTLGKKLDRLLIKVVVPLVIAGALVGLMLGYVVFYSNQFTDTGYRPQQPIAFSHRLHSGDLKISCFYCHSAAEKTATATVPPTQVCMNCHSVVKRDSPEIKKVIQSFEANKPIEWIRVHKLSDFVQFKHQVHIQAGVSCFECHGPVDQMDVIRQEKPLSMGWCLDCHRKKNILTQPSRLEDVIERASKDETFYEEIKGGLKKHQGTPWVQEHQRKKGSTNCSSCHY
ncbi:MAG: cytochrome c3 family protein [Deltaproteobacteria bacterium]|nr:cytochrome c3 family protein [Deltaproteobacteria bacterium]